MTRFTNALPETEKPVATAPYAFTCTRCGAEVTMSEEEQNWYYNHNLALPHRCAECRKAKRMAESRRRKAKAERKKAEPEYNG